MKSILAIFGLLIALSSYAEDKDDYVQTRFFTSDGKPTAEVQRWVSAAGLRLVKGREVFFPGYLRREHLNGCVTMAMHVGKDGVPVSYTALDAIAFDEKSRNYMLAAMIASLSEWRFEPAGRETEITVPISFSLEPERTGDSRLSIASKTATEQCATPLVYVETVMAYGLDMEKMPRSRYPFPASPGRESGCVVLGFSITSQGLADDYEIMASDLPERFIEATVVNANQWRFRGSSQDRSYAKFTYQSDKGSKTDTPVCAMTLPPTATESPTTP